MGSYSTDLARERTYGRGHGQTDLELLYGHRQQHQSGWGPWEEDLTPRQRRQLARAASPRKARGLLRKFFGA